MENENMKIYNAVRSVPEQATKPFDNGTFKGTDINPMWRIKTLTEQFGPVGVGWYYDVISERAEQHLGTTMAIVDLNLYVKIDGEWSKPIYGTGGNALVKDTKSGQKASDEGYKMALTDALSVACKALGIGADVYWQTDPTKYTKADKGAKSPQDAPQRTEAPKASKDTTESTKRATAQNTKPQEAQAQSAQGHAQEPKPAILDNDYFARILMELVEGQNITYKQLEMISARDFQKDIASLNEEERKQFYINTKKAVEKLKAKATEA